MLKGKLKYIFSIVIVVVFFWLAFKDFTEKDMNDLRRTLSEVNYGWIALTFVAFVISNLIRAWRWGILLSAVKPEMKLKNLFNATMIGYAVNQVLPRVGELTKAINLAKHEAVDTKKILASVVIERILDTIVFAMLLALSVFTFRERIDAAFGEVKVFGIPVSFQLGAYLMLAASLGLLVFFAALSLFPAQIAGAAERFFKRYSEKWATWISSALHAFVDGAAVLGDRTKYVEIIFSSLAIWGLYLLATLFPMYAMGFDVKHGMGAAEAMTTMSISAFGQLITPAGAGTYQYACTKTLEKLFNVPLGEASGYALLTFAIQLIDFGVVGFFCYLWQSRTDTATPVVPDVLSADTEPVQVKG